MRDAVADGLDAARRLPRLVKGVEAALAEVADGGFKLHPQTVQALSQARGGAPLAWLVAAGLALILAAVLI